MQGDGDGALKAYQAGVVISKALVRRDPANSNGSVFQFIARVKISENDRRRHGLASFMYSISRTGWEPETGSWLPDHLAPRPAARERD